MHTWRNLGSVLSVYVLIKFLVCTFEPKPIQPQHPEHVDQTLSVRFLQTGTFDVCFMRVTF
jgi:hypothetical protein